MIHILKKINELSIGAEVYINGRLLIKRSKKIIAIRINDNFERIMLINKINRKDVK